MIRLKLLHIFLISAVLAAGIFLQPAFTGLFGFVVGASSRVEVWDSTEAMGGGERAFINEPVMFFANFTSLATSQPINGSNVSCGISFNISGDWTEPVNMTHNQSSGLYRYNRTFGLLANYSWNVTCDGSAQGYDLLGVADSDGVIVYRNDWWNNSWNYRLLIEVETGDYNVTNWPIERDLNFTDEFRQLAVSGTFDDNSTRLVEYNMTGGVTAEIPSQLDSYPGYEASENAVGEVIFIMNGTTENKTKRLFFLYFDMLENGAKEYPNYATNLSYAWSGDELEFNNSRLEFYMDTNRSENTSGLYTASLLGEAQKFFFVDETARTVEYIEYSNGTHNLSFDFAGNATMVQGPVRLVITQEGDEMVFGNTSLKTGEGRMIKKYYVYNKAGPQSLGTWIKVEQNFTNLAGYSVDRNSTPAGALAFDIVRGWQGITSLDSYLGNTTDPYSWYLAFATGNQIVGLVNLNETVPDFFVTNDGVMGRVGVHLQNNTIDPGESIVEKAAVYLGRGGTDEFLAIKNALRSPETITLGDPEPRFLNSRTETEFDLYNRNETILITVNVTYDPYDLVQYVNVSLDNGTAGPGDDINLTMYDNGTNGDENASDNVYTNYYNISNYENTGTWSAMAYLFDGNLLSLNQSQKNFTLTRELFVNTTIINPKGLALRIVNATIDVMNYRQDVWQPNVTMNCTVLFGSTIINQLDPDNITDYNNGSHLATLISPLYFGLFTLNCSANITGNDGYGTDEFTTEALETNVSIVVVPNNFTADNVTWLQNQSFLATVNATNTVNGTAYNTTISIGLPVNLTSNSTSAWCGDILISKSCIIDFNITVLQTTAPANFTSMLNVTWNNSNLVAGFNETSLNVTVGPTYILDVLEENVTGTVAAAKKKNIENITLRSFGNAELDNATFNVTGFDSDFNFTFIPVNFSTLDAGVSTQVEMYLEVTQGYPSGDYGGVLNVTSDNGGYEELPLNVTVSGTNMSLSVSPTNFTTDIITYYDGQNFTLDVNTTNLANATAFAVNMTLAFSTPFINTSNTTLHECGDKAKAGYCFGSFIIMVSNATPSGNYTINVSIVWDNPEIGIRVNSTLVNVTVSPNVNMTIAEDGLVGNITHGTTSIIGNFTMNSTGNDPIEGIEFRIEDPAQQLEDFSIVVIPNLTLTAAGNLSAGAAVLINVSVTVPLNYPPGVYNGFMNVTTSNAGYRNLSLQVTVPTSRTWFLEEPASLYCEHPETPEYGIGCNVTINNTGNVNITFNITPDWASATSEYNNTWPEYVNFEVANQTTFLFSMYYNVTGDPLEFYNATYQITGTQASPYSINYTFGLTPYVKPLIVLNETPATIAQLGNLEIMATITSQSGAAISYVYINVTRPDSTNDSFYMRRFGGSTDPYYYVIGFPTDSVSGTWGSSLLRGNYTYTVFAEDVADLNDSEKSSFFVYAALDISSQVTRSNGEYFQGESGTISYSSKDLSGTALSNVNANISIVDPTNRSLTVFNWQFITNSQGEPANWPNFQLFSDSATGTYNITTVSVYNDTSIGNVITNTTMSNFTVVERKPGMILLDLEAPAETSINDGLEVIAMITDGIENVDPDSILVSLYDPLYNPILENVSMTRLSTGRYLRWYNTSVSSNQGNWRWVVMITEGVNVITKDVYTRLVGGPYDVRDITIVDSSVPDLEISVIIENTGESYQETFIQWNLTRVDTGESLFDGDISRRIEGYEEYLFTIYPTSISYIGRVRISFLVTYAGTERAGASLPFNTTEAAPPPPPPPPGGPGAGPREPGAGPGPVGPPPGKPEIEITDYPAEIATEAGWTQYPSVTVNNTGGTTLHNVVLTIPGIPSSWYTVQPALLPLLNPWVSKTFVINLLVPEGTEARKYYGTLNATTNETYDEKLTSVIVFGSREDLVRYQLEKLKEEFEEFKEDVNATAAEGKKDLSRVYDMVGEIQHHIDLTEGYLDAKMFDEALNSVTTGWRLLDRGRELLRTAPLLQPITVIMIPDWMITLILMLVIIILALVLLMTKYKKRLRAMFKREVPEVRATHEMVGARTAAFPSGDAAAASAEAAVKEAEKEKIRKVLNLLEKEYKEGVISEKAYDDLRKRNEEKLTDLGG